MNNEGVTGLESKLGLENRVPETGPWHRGRRVGRVEHEDHLRGGMDRPWCCQNL